ncbi:hypothetical protein NL108_008415 [Boleophthalmus pectinirostris]|uniref:protein shisa-5-like n=1 Tax=Boleophthalmus pectinirostris TaxID=150288 RepID=UPI00242F04B7|nr:protein shisa-5-like [Boleophthalmus pectinirostris]KAJ0068468.1 hypothetical protein NL108_008415 [Boleophthalmus pectinirostris]
MASALSSFVVLALVVVFTPCIFALFDDDCESYTDISGVYHSRQLCGFQFCCGTCFNRYCCQDNIWRLSEKRQDDCTFIHSGGSVVPMVLGIGAFVFISLIFILCCVCPCCCLYKACRRPRPVVATTTHTTVISSTPQSYPQQPAATPQPYQAAQYAPYQPIPVQPGYGAQPMPYQGAPYVPGPPPTYQEATGPSYPAAPMPYSQAAFTPGQPPYPLQPPGPSPSHPPQPQPNAPQMDFLSQPAYNPDYVGNKM